MAHFHEDVLKKTKERVREALRTSPELKKQFVGTLILCQMEAGDISEPQLIEFIALAILTKPIMDEVVLRSTENS